MKKKVLIIVLVVGCLLIVVGCGLKLVNYFDGKRSEKKEATMLSVKEAITGEVGYYLENDNLVVSYNAKNKADNIVYIKKATFIIQEIDSKKEVYKKAVDVDKQVKPKKEIKIDFDGVEFDPNELKNYFLKVDVE